MGDQASQPSLEDRDVAEPFDGLMLDVESQGAWDESADVEEAEAAFVLLVGLCRLLDDYRIEQRNGPALRKTDDGNGPSDPNLRGSDAQPFAKT